MGKGSDFCDSCFILVRLCLDGLLGLLSLLDGLLLLLLNLEDRLDDLLLLDQKGTDDAVANAVSAARTSVRAGDSALVLRQTSILDGAEGGDLKRRTQGARGAKGSAKLFGCVGACTGTFGTYTLDSGAAVTARGSLAELGAVLELEFTSGSLNNLNLVGGGVVAVAATEGQALNHFVCESLP